MCKTTFIVLPRLQNISNFGEVGKWSTGYKMSLAILEEAIDGKNMMTEPGRV
jgi:hypothetical protein